MEIIVSTFYDNLLAMFFGIISSLVASSVYLWFFLRIKPNIAISDEIAETSSIDGEKEYLIKVINKGKKSIINVKAELYVINRSNVAEGSIDEHKKISLKIPEMMELEGMKDERINDYFAFHFCTRENLGEIWNDDIQKRLRFKIYASHSISGFSQVYSKDFYKKSLIKKGEFKYGDSTDLVVG